MDSNSKFNPEAFAQYLQTTVKLDSLQNITAHLDKDLRDSQNVLNEIRTLLSTVPKKVNSLDGGNNDPGQEHLSLFLAAGEPKLLMPDMAENTGDINLDNVIASMKSYTEDLRKKFVVPQPEKEFMHRETQQNINLEQYADTLDFFGKQVRNITAARQNQGNRNLELEEKLTQLCEEVNGFTKMVQAHSQLEVTSSNWTPAQQDDSALLYDNQINKLLLGIHEVTYLLKNKN